MAVVHTDMPKYKGELEVARQLAQIDDERLHLWFSLENIPGVSDIDLLIIHQDHGALVVEIKAIPINMIKEYSFNSVLIEGRKRSKGPVNQAYIGLRCLLNYLESKVPKHPFFIATACWPKISRHVWKNSWSSDSICELESKMFFDEDLFSTKDCFLNRLCQIVMTPPIRKGQDGSFRQITNEVIDKISEALNPNARPKMSPSDWYKLKQIEKGISKELKKTYPPASGVKTLFTGQPGTGKTFRLLEIALMHAYEGQRVLFLCFNKTLASDIRRLLSFHEKLKLTEQYIDVHDIFDFASLQALDMPYDETLSHDEWGELITQDLNDKKDELVKYDTVLLDEVQDMSEWHFDIAELYTHSNTTFCAALGQGQELYAADDSKNSPVVNFEKKHKFSKKALRRNFRNPAATFVFSRCFYEAYLDLNKVEKFISTMRNNTQFDLEFDRKNGGIPRKIIIDETDLPSYDDPFYGDMQKEIIEKQYFEIIESEFDRLRENDEPIDLLILVPETRGLHYQWAMSALKQFQESTGIGCSDLVNEKDRRRIAESNKIRIATFHSSRGLEAVRVIVFGADAIPNLSKKINFDLKKLCYIIFSRSLMDLTIVMRPISSEFSKFMDDVITKLHSQKPD